MADTRLTGSVYQRQGSAVVRHTYRLSGSTPTSTATKFLSLKASASAPIILEAQIVVTGAEAGITLSVGTVASGYTDLVNAASLTTAATGGTFLPASNAVGKYVITTDTDVYYKLSSALTTGVATIIIDTATINLDTTVF